MQQWLTEQLLAVRDDLETGQDVSPARRYRLEGAIECWLRHADLDAAAVMGWLDDCGITADVEVPVVRLQLDMRRAPVRPTAAD